MTEKKWFQQTEQTIHMPVTKALELINKLEWDGNLDTIAPELIVAACALAKVVDKLRKTEDGIPMIPDMEVWCNGVERPCVTKHGYDIVASSQVVGTRIGYSHFDGKCYSTQKAAEEALEKK